MDKHLKLKSDEKVGVAGDQQAGKQQSSTLTNEGQSAAGHKKKGHVGFKGGEGGIISSELASEEGKERQQGEEGGTDTARSIPPFTEGYGTTGSHELDSPGEKHHGFANAV